MNIFYVYEHWRPDKKECFYVGKGTGKRALHLTYRNPHHKNIQQKLERIGSFVEVRIVADGLTEQEAFRIERERIAFWRADGADLANLTDGGDGARGFIHPPESIEKMRRAKVGYKVPAATRAKALVATKGKKRPADVVARVAAGNRGKRRTAEQIKNNSDARIKYYEEHPEARDHLRKMNLGNKMSEENLAALVKANRGRALTKEHRAKIGAANKGNKSALGQKRSPETLEKMSISAQKREARKRLLRDGVH